jgi:hypothetical protein
MWELSCLIIMAPIIPGLPFGHFDFGSEFLLNVNFSEAFNFNGDFSFLPEVDFLATSSLGDEAFEYDNKSCNFSVKSKALLRLQDPRRCRQKKHAKNRTNYRASVMTFCWYIIIWLLDQFDIDPQAVLVRPIWQILLLVLHAS